MGKLFPYIHMLFHLQITQKISMKFDTGSLPIKLSREFNFGRYRFKGWKPFPPNAQTELY
jgi:hypothetical protein